LAVQDPAGGQVGGEDAEQQRGHRAGGAGAGDDERDS
jgi:hypothetical protein